MSRIQIYQPDQQPLDVLVVGGGIVGAGVARDAAMRGLRVVLVEQHDFAFGTSSRSSRLLHGGLRYLAQGHLKLVREASQEKRFLSQIAPHLAQPLAFVFPSFRDSGWPLWKLRMGVKLYDWLCGGQNFGRSRALSKEQTIGLVPGLREKGLRGAVKYYDGFTSDARLVIDTLRSAALLGATPLNYVRLDDAQRNEGIWECSLTDQHLSEPVRLRARSIVNATGPWSEKFLHSHVKLRLTKGVHLVVDQSRFSISDALVMVKGKRILFAIPWGDRVILGTTDTDYKGSIEAPSCDAEDLNYVLDVVNHNFPAARLTSADVISTWAGLRPLVTDDSDTPSDTSRQHEILMPEPGWFDVTGGKLTTHRLIAEQTVDRLVALIGRECPPCETAKHPLFPNSDKSKFSGVLPPPVSEKAVVHACQKEWATHLDDVMIRRMSWRYYYHDHAEISVRVAGWMSKSLGWDTKRRQEEIARYVQSTNSPATERVRDDSQKTIEQPSIEDRPGQRREAVRRESEQSR